MNSVPLRALEFQGWRDGWRGSLGGAPWAGQDILRPGAALPRPRAGDSEFQAHIPAVPRRHFPGPPGHTAARLPSPGARARRRQRALPFPLARASLPRWLRPPDWLASATPALPAPRVARPPAPPGAPAPPPPSARPPARPARLPAAGSATRPRAGPAPGARGSTNAAARLAGPGLAEVRPRVGAGGGDSSGRGARDGALESPAGASAPVLLIFLAFRSRPRSSVAR